MGAAWVKEGDGGVWVFYIVSPAVDEADGLEAYGRLARLLQGMPHPFWIDPHQVKLIGPGNQVAVALADVRRRLGRTRLLEYDGGNLGMMPIDGAYIYPTPASPAN